MASSASLRAKGVVWEKEVATYIGGERRRVKHPDMGDIAGFRSVVIECKAQGVYLLPQWIKQLQSAVDNANANLGLLAIKGKGKTAAKDGLWLIDPRCIPYIIELVERNS